MTSRDILDRLATLTERERQILRRVCFDAKDYKTIAAELGIKDGTVKSHMGNIYVKLGLEFQTRTQRKKSLFEDYCPALKNETLPEPPADPAESAEPEPVSEEVLRLVEEDEYAIIPIDVPVIVVDQEVEAPVPERRRRGGGRIFWLLAGVILGVLLVPAGVYVVQQVFGLEVPDIRITGQGIAPEVDQSEHSTEDIAPAPQAEVIIEYVVVTATPHPVTATSEPSSTPQPTATREPTNTSQPTHTPRPAKTSTPEGLVTTIVEVDGEETNTAGGDGWGSDPTSWYNTGIYVAGGDQLSITYLGGEWWIGRRQGSENLAQTPTDADGYAGREEDRVVAEMSAENVDKCYALRSAPIGSLIGRIGENGPVFFVGNNYDTVANGTGILFLRMNYNSRVGYAVSFGRDCPDSNGGAISVEVGVIP